MDFCLVFFFFFVRVFYVCCLHISSRVIDEATSHSEQQARDGSLEESHGLENISILSNAYASP